MANELVDSEKFYAASGGHRVAHLKRLLPKLREDSDTLLWVAGGSSLDNKSWIQTGGEKGAVGPYTQALDPPTSICDVAYWLNHLLEQQRGDGVRISAINTAVEGATLNERCYRLKPQDRFCRDNIRSNDVLIVSVGGDDLFSSPTPCTMAAWRCLTTSTTGATVESGTIRCTVPINDCCCGCGASFLSCAGASPPCLGYFHHLFGVRLKLYIEALTIKTRPKKIILCMPFFPAEQKSTNDDMKERSNSIRALGVLKYDSEPERVQTLIRNLFEYSTSRIQITGSEVIPVPLYRILSGKTSSDYAGRCHLSAVGGYKVAVFLLDIIQQVPFAGEQQWESSIVSSEYEDDGAPDAAIMVERE